MYTYLLFTMLIGVAMAMIGFSCNDGNPDTSHITHDVESPYQKAQIRTEKSPNMASPEATLTRANSSTDVGGDIGDVALPFTLVWPDKDSVKLQSLLRQETPVILYFYTTW